MMSAAATLHDTLSSAQVPIPPDIHSFWVFGLLRPTVLKVLPLGTSRLHCKGVAGACILESPRSLAVENSSLPLRISSVNGEAVAFVLEVPDVIRRAYFGTVEIRANARGYVPVVSMHRETAVGSIVGAELPVTGTPIDAAAAQAIVARSFIAGTARPRHAEADFCDTTHCQFLRSPAPNGTAIAEAVRLTRDLALFSGAGPIAARYSAACGGRTRGGRENGYVYQPVECEICQQAHLARRGHGLGLCQEGAIGLARAGWTWPHILRKYYPGTSVESLSC